MSKVKEFKKHLLSRGVYYPILYSYVEINQKLAEKIVEILCRERCSVEESIHFIDATFSMMRESRFSMSASARTTRAQRSSSTTNQAQEGEHRSSLASLYFSVARSPALNSGQNRSTDDLRIEKIMIQIRRLLLSARINFYEVVGTLEYAKHLVHSSVLVEE